MSQLHPVFQQALSPFIHRRPKPTETFHYTLCDVQVECEIEYEAGYRGARGEYGLQMEPDQPDCATLHTVHIGNVNIYEILSDEQREEIESAFLQSNRE